MAIRPKVRAANVSPSILCRRLKREPAMGAMQEGEIVLVDDGSCPKGQIKRVVGGNHVKVGGYKQVVRTRSCVPVEGRSALTGGFPRRHARKVFKRLS
jgi:hypothetical protein